MAINALNALLVYRFRYNQAVFCLCIELMYMVFAGIYSILPIATYQTFGPKQGPRAFAVILMGNTLGAVTSYIDQHFLYDLIGVENILRIGSISSVLAMMVCFSFSENLDFERMDRLGLIEWGSLKSKYALPTETK